MHTRNIQFLGILVTSCTALSCSVTTSDDDALHLIVESIRINPAHPVVDIVNGVPAMREFRVIGMDAAGDEADVTAHAQLSLDSAWLGAFSGPVLITTADQAGRSAITARYGDKTATGEVTIVRTQVVMTPGVPADTPARFDAAIPGGNPPTLVYPGTNLMVPPNLNSIEFHYMPGMDNNLFLLEFVGNLVKVDIYVTCLSVGSGCYYAPDEHTWEILANAGRGEAPLYYSVRGLSTATSTVSASESHTIGFSFFDIEGGIYYWAAGNSGIMRYDFGLRGQLAEAFLGTADTGATQCVGCHTLSRDGSVIAVGLDIPGPAAVETYTVATRELLWNVGGATGGGANFSTFSPDNAQIILSNGVNMNLADAQTGALINTVVDSGTMPDWSPDGQSVVYARPDTPIPCPAPLFCGAVGMTDGNIEVIDTATWSAVQPLAASDGGNNYYPSFSPDGEWIIYNRSLAGDSFDATDARVWTVHRSGGTPIQLGNGSPAPGGDSWPKWAPFVDEYRDGRLMWLTFSSRRDYGLRNVAPGNTAQLWMVGFDPARAATGQDPSFSAFWLPFQNPLSSNHIAQWVENIDRQPCDTTDECPGGEICMDGVCIPMIE